MKTDYKNLKAYKKSQVNGLTKYLIGKRFESEDQRGWDSIIKLAENLGLSVGYCGNYHGERLDFDKPKKITKEQTELGKAWLKNHFFKLNGKPRTGKNTENVSDRVLRIAKRVSRFEFVGVAVLASSGWYPVQAVPIYRTYNRKGEYFDYSPIHWGQPIIDESN
jgi:hypothetical protein